MRDGYKLWRKNLILCIPFLCNFLVTVLLGVILFLLIIFAIFQGRELSSILLIIFVVLIGIIIYLLSNSFFTAGAIGMAKEILMKGNTNLQDMLLYGKKKFLKLFFFNLILLLLGIPAIAFLFIHGFTGINLTYLYLFAVSILFTPIPYTIVISDTNVSDGIKKGFKFIKENKLSFLLLFFFNRFIETISTIVALILAFILFIAILAFTLPSIPLSYEAIIMNLNAIRSSLIFGVLIAFIFLFILYVLISIFVVSPLTNLWFAKLYSERTKI